MNNIFFNIKKDQEIVRQKEEHRQLKLIGSVKPQKGHKLFSFNRINNEIIQEQINECYINTFNSSIKSKVIIDENKVYVTALNKKNAEKKFKKIL